jgi:DNA-binding beta-propeller fold protein YncE
MDIKRWITVKKQIKGLFLILTAVILVGPQISHSQNIERQANEAIQHLAVQGHPFSAIPSKDGQWLFVALSGPKQSLLGNFFRSAANDVAMNGIAVLRKVDGVFTFVRFVPVSGNPTGLILTHDGKILIVAALKHIVFIDALRLIGGENDAVLGTLATTGEPGSITVNVTQNDRFLFVAEEFSGKITVVDLAKALGTNFSADAIVGSIPVGYAPIALIFSPDERYLYTSIQRAQRSARWPNECAMEGAAGEKDPTLKFPQGAIVVVDMEQAKMHPETAVVAQTPAGCNPVRLTLGPNGDLAFVTARKDNEVLVLDMKKIFDDPQRVKLGRFAVGQSPVGIAIDKSGRRLYVTNSDRFSGDSNSSQFVTVIDASDSENGKLRTVGRIPAGAFPRELALTQDQGTLIISNYLSKTIEFVDLRKLNLETLGSP